MRINEFFQEDNGRLSSVRLYGFVALIVAAILTFKGGSFELILTWLSFSFGGKTAQKLIEKQVDKK